LVNFNHEGLLVYATGADIYSEKPNPSTTMKLAQKEETETEVTVIEGEVFVCPSSARRADGTYDLDACVAVTDGEYVTVWPDDVSNPTDAPPDEMDDALEDVDEIEAPPELIPPGELPPITEDPIPPGEEPFERPAPEPASKSET
jgi:hypothetical protein